MTPVFITAIISERTRPYIVSAWADAQGIVLGRVKKAHHCGYVVSQRYVMWSDEELGKAVFGKVVD